MPRATTIEFGTSDVGIEGGFLAWEEVQRLRDRACKKKRKGGDALDLMRDVALGVR